MPGPDYRLAAGDVLDVQISGRIDTIRQQPVVDYEGKVKVGNVGEITVKEAWRRLGERVRRPHREHRWKDIPDLCKGCGDWQVAGAEYEEESVEGTRPFWYYDKNERSAVG